MKRKFYWIDNRDEIMENTYKPYGNARSNEVCLSVAVETEKEENAQSKVAPKHFS